MAEKGVSRTGRVWISIFGLPIGAVFSAFVTKVLDRWGVLDSLANALGDFLKANVSREGFGLGFGSVLFAALYGFLLWKVWRPLHIHHVDLAPEQTKLGDHVEAEVRRPAPEAPETEEERVLRECTAPDGTVDRARYRKEVDRITDPSREYNEAWDEFDEADKRANQVTGSKKDSPHLERSRAAIQAMDDDLKEGEKRAADLLSSMVSPSKHGDVHRGLYRNCTLADALGWAIHGEWGKPKFMGGIEVPIGVHTDARKVLARFSQLAGEGKLTIWGKRDDPGYYEKIPQSHWKDHSLTVADLYGSLTSGGDDPYYELMLNKAEVEREWPHEG